MLSRLTRPAAATTLSLVALATLAACGDEDPGEKTAAGFDAVSVSGEFGEVPEIEWSAALEPGDTEVEVLEEGDGPALEDGDQLLVNYAVSNDVERAIGFDTFGDEGAITLTVGEEKEATQVTDLITRLVNEQIEPGTTKVGTRFAWAIDVKEEFSTGEALALRTLKVGNEDGMVLVADLEGVPLEGPEGRAKAAPRWAPDITFKKGEPTDLDTSGQPEPDAKATALDQAVLIQGTGTTVEKGDLIYVNYIGQTYGGDKPFDNSFARKDPATFTIGVGAVVDGWDQGLVGQKVGSRVLLRIPPKLGYGKQGQGEDIPGNSTLYFVIDILAAA